MSRNSVIAAAGLLLIVLVAYLPAFRAGFIWDDDDYVVNNETLRSRQGLHRIWLDPTATKQYYPLVFTSFWAEYRVWRLHPAGYHVINVLLHGANAILVWLVLRRLALPGAWLAAAVFAVHPVEVESVAWITERKNVLSGFFYGLALLAYLRFAPPEPDTPAPPNRWRWYALALLLFFCALLSKTVTCSLPAVLLLLLWWKRGRVTVRDGLALAPLFALGLLMAGVTVWLESGHVGAHGPDFQFSWVERCLIAGRALWFYAGKLLWPEPLIFYYPRWQIDASAWWQYLFPAAALALLLALFLLRGRIGRGPVVAALFFAGTLLPALGFINVYPMLFSFVADHFQYLACIGLLAAGAAGTVLLARWLGVSRFLGVQLTAAALLLAILGTLTWRQCRAYENLDTLWTDTVTKNPDAWAAHYNLGHLRLSQGRLDEAIAEFETTLRLRPQYDAAECNWGQALVRQGKLTEARVQFEKALALAATATNHLNLAALCLEEGKYAEARKHLEDAQAVDPDHAATYNVLGHWHARQGQWPEAVAALEKAVQLAPDVAAYHYQLAEYLQKAGQTAAAQARLREAQRRDPQSLLYEGPGAPR